MTRINTNVSSLVAQKTLSRSNSQLQESLTRLSTGLRINVGKDDPAGLIASEVLRSDIVSVTKAISNSERANQLIATADSALGQVSSLLNDIRGLVSESANTGALSADQIAANQLQIDSSLEAIDRVAQTTAFQGRRLLDGGLDFITSSLEGFASGTVGKTAAVKAQGVIGDLDGTAASGQIGTAAVNSFQLTATANGKDLNDVKVVYANTATAGNETATYDADTKTITVGVQSTVTTTAQVRTAINNSLGGTFSATSLGNDAGTVATGTATGLTSGGNFGNQITLTAKEAGAAANGDVFFSISAAVDKGAELVNYDAGTNTLQITTNVNSTANDIAAAINRATGDDAVYTATVQGVGTGTYNLGAAAVKATGTIGNANGVAATGLIGTGGSNSFTLTADIAGTDYNGVTVNYVAGGTAGAETASYNSTSKVLTVNIDTGVSTVAQVRNAINAQVGNLFTATATADAGTVTAGAAAGTTATGAAANAISLVAKDGGTASNGSVQITVSGAVAAGAETVSYAGSTLTVTINAASTATQIASAINNATAGNDKYVATALGNGNGVFATTTFTNVLTGGAAGTTSGTLTNAVGGGALGSQFKLTAKNAGPSYDGVDVAYVTDAGLGAGVAQVAYNSVNKLLTVTHNAATVNAVVDAINNDTTVGSLFSATALDAGTGAVTSTTDNTTDATQGGALGNENIVDLRIDQANFGTANSIGVSVNVDAQAKQGTLRYTGGSLTSDLILEVGGQKGFEVFNFGVGTTIQQIQTAVNTVKDATGIEADISGGELHLKSTDYGSKSFASARSLSGSFNTVNEAGVASGRENGSDVAVRINGVKATGDGLRASLNTSTLDLTFSLGATVQAGDTLQFNITGGGATFQLGPDVVSNQQARLGIQGVSTATLGGVSGALFELRSGGAKSLSTDVKGAAAVVDEVISSITGLRGRLGAFQKTTLETNINTLGDTLTNLTDAESSIRDADFAAESARLTRAQILVQSGTQVLQIANQNPQNVLSLLRG